MKPPSRGLPRKPSAASNMFHDAHDRARSSTGHSTLRTADDADLEEYADGARASSIAVLHFDKHAAHDDDDDAAIHSGERLSWWDRSSNRAPLTCGQRTRLLIDFILLLAIGVGLFFAAHFSQNRALPFVYATLAALAAFESTWLSYRLRLRLYLPFQLHSKQTCRDIYRQIMNYSVDLQTCAISPFAERMFKGRKLLAAAVVSLASAGVALLLSWLLLSDKLLAAYIATTTFLCVWICSLAPNPRDATVLFCRYMYFVLSTASLLILSPPTASLTQPNVVLDPFHLMLLSALLIMIARAVTSKDPMETVVVVLLDLSSLVYLAGLANVLNYLTAFTSTKVNNAEAFASRHAIVFGVFFIVWCAEMGSFLMEKLLRATNFPYAHPLSSRLSSRQNYEKLIGALLFGVAASFLVTKALLPQEILPINNLVFMATSIAAVVLSHICKLWLICLKKVAKVSSTGRYLRVGDGVMDRIDSLLVSTIVFTIVLRRVLV